MNRERDKKGRGERIGKERSSRSWFHSYPNPPPSDTSPPRHPTCHPSPPAYSINKFFYPPSIRTMSTAGWGLRSSFILRLPHPSSRNTFVASTTPIFGTFPNWHIPIALFYSLVPVVILAMTLGSSLSSVVDCRPSCQKHLRIGSRNLLMVFVLLE